MSDSNLKFDIVDILDKKSKGEKTVKIYYNNLEFFEEILGNEFCKDFQGVLDLSVITHLDHFVTLKLAKITPEDVSTLEEYLDYIKLVEGN